MLKRANGEGTMSRRKDSSGKTIGWRAAVTIGENEDGSQKRRWVSGKTQGEVQEKLRALQSDLHRGTLADTDRMTVGDFLKQWVAHKEREGLKPNTVQSYRDTINRYVTPKIGRVKLEKLRPLDIEHMLTSLREDGKSPTLLAYSLRVLKMALQQAVRWQMLPRNVADSVKPPKIERQEMKVWTRQQVAAFLKVTEEHPLHAAFYLALMTGMRRGELVGLKWDDLDLDRARLTVKNNLVEVIDEPIEGKKRLGKATQSSVRLEVSTPKSKASRRTIVLSKGTVEKLREQRARQEAWRRDAAEAWTEQGFVFTTVTGGLVWPSALAKAYVSLVAEAKVPSIRFHDMRHTAASLMISMGIPPKTVSERLGHSDVAFTLRTYTHLYDAQREEAAFDIADLI
ncbi:tyrosine-type recombinase/integrase [Deinococcus daejeonensis]|uniref:Site-specific integrase n=1 Tax=Deinococcus daejeonensis TaxID=1007098 RepID=A0ABQ2J250_9DEIO|nr:site-specific integrase [Deinococcus daejeonensis]GGN34641.1 site-specific integrase [Deinococcus daejeonensis]